MFKISQYERHRGPNQQIHNGSTLPGRYQTRDEAREAAKGEASNYDKHGYNEEHDYFWGWDDDDDLGRIFIIEADRVPGM